MRGTAGRGGALLSLLCTGTVSNSSSRLPSNGAKIANS
jgi:hypothetical protein